MGCTAPGGSLASSGDLARAGPNATVAVSTLPAEAGPVEPANQTKTNAPATSFSYIGAHLAGSTTPYLRYNEADYQTALKGNKTIYLYFRANWCPICNQDRPAILTIFNELRNPDVVGFEVHYNDEETTEADRSLSRQFGVTYQHTTIILQNGSVVYRSLITIPQDDLKTRLS